MFACAANALAASLIEILFARWARLRERVIAIERARCDAAHLRRLDDHVLADIGLERSRIDAVLASGRTDE